jgi:hypothetical protein
LKTYLERRIITKQAVVKHGVEGWRLIYDSFEFGLDVPVRVLAKPH